MLDINYANANTLIRIKEKELLTKEQFDMLLKAPSFEQLLQQLKTTPYASINFQYNEQLMTHLEQFYAQLFDFTPDKAIIELFSLIYVYHNLKILLKQKLTSIQLESCVIQIGPYSVEQLQHLVDTVQLHDNNELYHLPNRLVQSVVDTMAYYNDYEQVESIDILMDRAYFNHIYDIAIEKNDVFLIQLIQSWIDIYNVSVVMRCANLSVSRSFLMGVLAENGSIPLQQLVELAVNGNSQEAYTLFRLTSYSQYADRYFGHDVATGVKVELFKDYITHLYCHDARYEAFGFKPLFAYIFYKEMEIKNLKLLLTGKDNAISDVVLKERMKPIYDL